MACKPKRRRHNKQTPAYIMVGKVDGGVEKVPVNRKGFKVDERELRLEASHDVGVIKQAIFGIGKDDVVYIHKSRLKNQKLAGYRDHQGVKLVRKEDQEKDIEKAFLAGVMKKVKNAFSKEKRKNGK